MNFLFYSIPTWASKHLSSLELACYAAIAVKLQRRGAYEFYFANCPRNVEDLEGTLRGAKTIWLSSVALHVAGARCASCFSFGSRTHFPTWHETVCHANV